jgi:hypothetical protein
MSNGAFRKMISIGHALQPWANTGDDTEATVDLFEEMPQEDDLEDIIMDDEAQ